MYSFVEPIKEVTISIYNCESNPPEEATKCEKCIRCDSCLDIDKLACNNNGCKHFTEELLK